MGKLLIFSNVNNKVMKVYYIDEDNQHNKN